MKFPLLPRSPICLCQSAAWHLLLLTLLLGIGRTHGAVPDSVYWQETGERVGSEIPLNSVAVLGDRVWVGTGAGLLELRGHQLERVGEIGAGVTRLVVSDRRVWALTEAGLYRGGEAGWIRVATNRFTDLVEHQGSVLAAADRRLFRVLESRVEAVEGGEAPFAIHRLSSHQEALWVCGLDRLSPWIRGTFGGLDAYGFPADQAWDWGDPPAREFRDLLALGDRLILATPRGLGVLRGMVMQPHRGSDGLPQEDVTCLAAGWNGDLWIGTSQGAVRQTAGLHHYFAGRRWLPDDRVLSIATGDRVVYLATPRGLGIIRFLPFTLARKAAYYERYIEASGQKRLGLLHKLEWDEGLKACVREAGDNDGGYSGDYLTAQSYRFAVTRDPGEGRDRSQGHRRIRRLSRRVARFQGGSAVRMEGGHLER